jgi:hypothetical protein
MPAKRAVNSAAKITSQLIWGPIARIGKAIGPLLEQSALDCKEQEFVRDLLTRRIKAHGIVAILELCWPWIAAIS